MKIQIEDLKSDETLSFLIVKGLCRWNWGVCMAVSMMPPVEEIVCIFVFASSLGGRTMRRSKSRKLVGVGNSHCIACPLPLGCQHLDTCICLTLFCHLVYMYVYFYNRREMDMLKVNWYGAACFQRDACGK